MNKDEDGILFLLQSSSIESDHGGYQLHCHRCLTYTTEYSGTTRVESGMNRTTIISTLGTRLRFMGKKTAMFPVQVQIEVQIFNFSDCIV